MLISKIFALINFRERVQKSPEIVKSIHAKIYPSKAAVTEKATTPKFKSLIELIKECLHRIICEIFIKIKSLSKKETNFWTDLNILSWHLQSKVYTFLFYKNSAFFGSASVFL